MKYTVNIGSKPIELIHDNFDDVIDVDSLTKIDTSNLFGEHVTMSAAVNRIGLMKAEVQSIMDSTKLDIKMYEGKFKSRLRKEAAENQGKYTIRVENEDVLVKLTEKALETSFETDPQWIKLKKAFIKAEKDFNSLDALYWACQDKSRKLNGLVNGTTPEDYVSNIIEGKINGVLIKK